MGDQAGRDDPSRTVKQMAAGRGFVVVDKHVLVDKVEFQDLIQKVEQNDGKVEIRVGHSPVNGPTEDGNGTWYLPTNEPVYCTIRSDGQWLVEFSDDTEIIAVVLSAHVLFDKTRRRTQ